MVKYRKKNEKRKKRPSRKASDAPVIVKDGIRDPSSADEELQEGASVLLTLTGELYQLARIYYEVADPARLIDHFNRLRCVVNDPPNNRWVWLFEDEARNLKFEKAYSSIPRSRRPIVLGSFFFKGSRVAYLNTNSFDRATKAIEFFDKHVDRAVLKLTEMTVVNRAFDATQQSPPCHEEYIDRGRVTRQDPEALLNRAAMIGSSVLSPLKKAKLAMSLLMRGAQAPLPLVETFPIESYYEDGIGGINLSLMSRRIVAMRHLEGDKDFSLADVVEKLIKCE